MQDLLSLKIWTERRALSRGRWGVSNWEQKYSISWGNRHTWREEKKKLAQAQKSMSLIYELEN